MVKTFFLTFVAVLVAVGLALFVYDRLVLQARLADVAEAAHISLDQVRAEAQDIAGDLADSVERSTSDARTALEEQIAQDDRRRAVLAAENEFSRQQAEATEAVLRGNVFKLSVAEHYLSMGTWPGSVGAVGLGEPASHAGGPVESIDLEAEGVIAIRLKPEVADGGVIRLIPRASGFSGIEWRCQASGYPAAMTLPNCGD